MEQVDAGRDECADEIAPIARGFLLALALPSVAVLLLDTQKAGGALKILAEIATLPAFIAVAGWVMGPSIVATARSSFLRAIAPAALCGVTGALVAGAAALPTGHDWRYGLMQAAPAWTLPLLTATYAATARALRHSPFARFLLAAVAHVAGVVSDTPMLTYFIYFATGLALVSRRTTLLRIADEEQEFAIGSGPLLATLAAAAAFRFAQTGHAASLAAVGPIALAIGLVAGPAALACASALRGSTVGAAFAGLGRAAPALAIFWLPLFSLLIAAANRGAPPSVASALLMATASLLFIVVLVDVLKGAEKTRLGRLFAPS